MSINTHSVDIDSHASWLSLVVESSRAVFKGQIEFWVASQLGEQHVSFKNINVTFRGYKGNPPTLDICSPQSMRALLRLIIIINRTTLEIAINCHLHAFQKSFQLLNGEATIYN